MAKVNQRLWKIPGQRTKRKAWGYTAQVPCKPCPHRHPNTGAVLHPAGVRQVRSYKAQWTREDAEKSLAAELLQLEPEKPKASGITLEVAANRYLGVKIRKRSLARDRRQLEHLKLAFGADTRLADIMRAESANPKQVGYPRRERSERTRMRSNAA